MCGIVGHYGTKDSVEIVLEGLRRLEYRGYDSAGVSFIDEHNQLYVYKKEGKLQNLKDYLAEVEVNYSTARSAIGHTRWATHGGVNDTNAHPHHSDRLTMVHNGIIENFNEIRNDLKKEGVEFLSETDSEVFLRLVDYKVKNGLNLVEAVSTAFKEIRGNSSFVFLDKQTGEMLAIKRGAPLVCGMSELGSEVLVSSDPYALIGNASKIYFPQDEVICSISAANKNLLKFLELDGKESDRFEKREQQMTLEATEKGDFEHFMLKEIHEQPELIRVLTQYYFGGEGEESLRKMKSLAPKRVSISACGTAAYAGLVIRDFLEGINRIPTNLEIASEFRYRNPIINPDDLGLFISQSGETADTLAAQQLCKDNGIKTASIVNVEGSTLYRDCDENLLIRAGVEIGVASTKAFTQQSLTGRLLSLALEGKAEDEKERMKISNKFALLADRIDDLLKRTDEIKRISEKVHNKKGYFYTGRGAYFPIALEGALKLKEIAYVHAEGYAAGELKHGPIALIDEEMVNVALVGPELYEKTVSNIQEIKARKGIILTVGPRGDKELEELSDYYIPLNFDGLEELSPIYINVVNQMLAYYMALYKGTDIDKPRNLAKSVTVE